MAPKRKNSKQKSSRDHEGYSSTNFHEWQKQLKITQNRPQFNALSPKTMKSKLMKSSGNGISGIEQYQRMTNPSKYSESRASNDKRMISYLNTLASDGSRSKEDHKFIPVENISLFDDSKAPLSARNPRISGGFYSQQNASSGISLKNNNFIKNFRILRIFK